jgi:hypothetical protein
MWLVRFDAASRAGRGPIGLTDATDGCRQFLNAHVILLRKKMRRGGFPSPHRVTLTGTT